MRVTIRYAVEDDAPALARLAALDSARTPAGPVLLAEVGDELWAAMAIHHDPSRRSSAIADPFRPSGPLVELLQARARQLTGERPRRRLRLRPRRATAPQAVASMFSRT
jgi:hypothetical protein